ncbi:MAG: ubiquinol-cytochrome c reductase iron-sulfur subunit [Deinococcales bacterium]|jgi:menaquinol-cytochrome c reductase iron-sulfur subunit
MTDKPTNPMAEGEASGTPSSDDLSRRRFLGRTSLGLGAFAALLVGIPTLLDVIKPMWRSHPRVWRTLGPVDNYKTGQTVEVSFENAGTDGWGGAAAKTAAYLRRDGQTSFTAFTVNCSHLGCPVHWEQSADMFVCPCHGGVYYANGDVAAGPPPRPLARYPVRVQNGNVEILTTPLPLNGRVPKQG